MDLNNKKYVRFTRAAAFGSIAASLVVLILTIGGEEWSPLKDALKNTFTHHWLGKSALALLAFLAFFAIFARLSSDQRRATWALWGAFATAIFSSAAMVLFFILHALGFV